MPTEKSTERPQTTISFTQTIVSDTTPFVKVFETTLKIEEIKIEEKPTESKITSDAMTMQEVTPDPTIVKSDQISTLVRDTTPPQILNITTIIEEKIEEIATKDPLLITTSYPNVGNDESLLTTKTISEDSTLLTETTKPEEITTRMIEDKIETVLPNDEPKSSSSAVKSEETTTQTLTTIPLKFVDETKDEMTTERVTETIAQTNTTKSYEDNSDTTSPSTSRLLTDLSSTQKSNEVSSFETTTNNVIAEELTTKSNITENSFDSEISIDSKDINSNTESLTTKMDRESGVSTLGSDIIEL